jgi:archaeosine synthase
MLGENRKRIHVATISEPFGLVPEEFYEKKTRWHDWKNEWYDCPGLFEWWCKKYGTHYSAEEADKCIEILASKIALFLRKVRRRKRYESIIAFVRNYSSNLKKTRDQTHRRIIEKAARISNVDVLVMPSRELVSRIVRRKGKFAWDMYGVSHPDSQAYLLKRLKAILHGDD